MSKVVVSVNMRQLLKTFVYDLTGTFDSEWIWYSFDVNKYFFTTSFV